MGFYKILIITVTNLISDFSSSELCLHDYSVLEKLGQVLQLQNFKMVESKLLAVMTCQPIKFPLKLIELKLISIKALSHNILIGVT